ncbi:hypothetical protein DMO17_06655 [Aquipseudomonas alcaligenes]|uniref:DUF2188 domain-containing protein n=1 Tax=Aquipseudomonas alcaligenes TaxID=43263 RepID=A0A2V4MB85_AQUAC|nr:hypothetical protein [Pseudomonas alcaligenes]PYC27416.1 hypothetical protein DMO17_06655 [Pseudomonas alcaligenes]
MDIRIRQLSTANGPRWQVCLDQHGVSFRSEREALEFIATLETRLKAPHPLPWRDSGATRNAS